MDFLSSYDTKPELRLLGSLRLYAIKPFGFGSHSNIGCDLFLMHRRRTEVILHHKTTQLSQRYQLLVRFDTLDHAVKAHVATKCQQRLDGLEVRRILIEIGNETAVDLDLRQGQSVQTRQA